MLLANFFCLFEQLKWADKNSFIFFTVDISINKTWKKNKRHKQMKPKNESLCVDSWKVAVWSGLSSIWDYIFWCY